MASRPDGAFQHGVSRRRTAAAKSTPQDNEREDQSPRPAPAAPLDVRMSPDSRERGARRANRVETCFPRRRFRTSASPLGISSSASTNHGPASSRPAVSSPRSRRAAIRANREVVLDDDCLPVEQERFAFARRVGDQLIDEVDEALPKFPGVADTTRGPNECGRRDERRARSVDGLGGAVAASTFGRRPASGFRERF